MLPWKRTVFVGKLELGELKQKKDKKDQLSSLLLQKEWCKKVENWKSCEHSKTYTRVRQWCTSEGKEGWTSFFTSRRCFRFYGCVRPRTGSKVIIRERPFIFKHVEKKWTQKVDFCQRYDFLKKCTWILASRISPPLSKNAACSECWNKRFRPDGLDPW